ncbi:HET-domain-containing protein, partial [Cadophora sp. DSE1049]
IRLLRINPALDHSDAVECTLEYVSLQNKPIYNALSYVWGDVNVTDTVLVNGQHFEATKNLVAALRERRKSRLSESTWIDAVCINQKSVDEKTQQVRLMRDIYCAAQKTLVWL